MTAVAGRMPQIARTFVPNQYIRSGNSVLRSFTRNLKCKTPPVYKRDKAGKLTNEEDHSRTNVAMPDLNIIYRRNAARMMAQPYRLRYSGGTDPQIADMLSALSIWRIFGDLKAILVLNGLPQADHRRV
jgi:hypothetical protein